MKNIIIGTAGHVDHGKTSLIKALSGIDTDRLEEEKKRGITIELGFAHIPNDAGYNIGVIDVPGHEKFIKNMLAGIGGIDFVLFVVAADEGIMPQTREHFEILNALGIDDGIIAVTKTDMVEKEWLEMLLEEVDDYFRGTFLEGKPVIPVSAYTGDNIETLREAIISKCDRENKRREEPGLFRLPVDRVFTMSGFGTVVTGTLVDGTVHTGDTIMIYPHKGEGQGGTDGRRVKIRGIETYGHETDTAVAGQRTAINLAAVGKDDVSRGDVLAARDAVAVTSMLDVSLKMFSDSDRTVLNNSRVHLYSGAAEVLAKVILLDREALSAGEECYAQLRLEKPMALRRGDRFIIRFYSPIITIGGGRILDTLPEKHKRNREDVLEAIQIMDRGSISDIMTLKTGGHRNIRQEDLGRELGLLPEETESIVSSLSGTAMIRLNDSTLLSLPKYDRMKEDLETMIRTYHDANPLSDGMARQELFSRLKDCWHTDDDRFVQSFVKHMTDEGSLQDRGKTVALSGFSIEYTEEQKAFRSDLADRYRKAGLEMIRTDEILGLSSGEINTGMITAVLEDLESEGVITKVNPSYYISSEAWAEAVEAAKSFDGEFTLADYRDRLGTSRKYAAELLPAMDKAGITIFNGTSRIAIRK